MEKIRVSLGQANQGNSEKSAREQRNLARKKIFTGKEKLKELEKH